MKTTKFLLGALAAFSFAGISCQREEPIVEQPPEEVHMTLIASSDDETRSILQPDGQTVLWGANEQLHVFETIYGPEAPSTIQRASSIGTSSDGGVTMSFGVSFPTNVTGTSYVYNAVYPNSAYVSGNDNKDPTNLRVITPSTQKATATSFDGDADLLIAKQVTETSQPSSITLGFKRMLVVGKMTLNNIASEANVKSVKFSSPNKKITGRSTMNLTTGEAIEYGYNSEDYVEVTYEDNIPANGLTVFFTCFPFQIAAGESFTVEVKTKDQKVFTRTVTIPSGRSLAFALGENTKFSVDMTNAVQNDEIVLESGNYLILAKKTSDNTYYALKAEKDGSSNRLVSEDYSGSLDSYSGDASLIWTVTKSDDSDTYTVENGNKFLGYTGNKNESYWLEAGENWTSDAYLLDISAEDGGYYHVRPHSYANRYLSRNTGSAFFAFYGNTGQYAQILFVPAVENQDGWVLVENAADVVAGEYVITWDNKYYLPNALAQKNPAVGTGITVGNAVLTNPISDDMIWKFTGDNTNGFVISAVMSSTTHYLSSADASEGIAVVNASKYNNDDPKYYNWTVVVDTENAKGMLLDGFGTNRYLAVYNNSSWRNYALTNYNGTMRLYKYQGPSTPDPGTYAISWTDPTETGCTVSATVDGTSIHSGDSFAEGTVVTITATAGSGYTFSEWTISGANVASTTSTTTTFTVSTSPVSFSASFIPNGGAGYATSVIDFENELTDYTTWSFTNIKSNNTEITAHGGNKYGANINSNGNAVSTASISTKSPVSKPYSVKFYISKASNNTTASSWYVQVSSNGSNWTNVETIDATDMSKGTWIEKSVSLAQYTNVYVRVYYNGSNALRTIDDIELKYQTN